MTKEITQEEIRATFERFAQEHPEIREFNPYEEPERFEELAKQWIDPRIYGMLVARAAKYGTPLFSEVLRDMVNEERIKELITKWAKEFGETGKVTLDTDTDTAKPTSTPTDIATSTPVAKATSTGLPAGFDQPPGIERDDHLERIEEYLEIVKAGLGSKVLNDKEAEQLKFFLGWAEWRMDQAANLFLDYLPPLKAPEIRRSAKTVAAFANWMEKRYPQASGEITALKEAAELLMLHAEDIHEEAQAQPDGQKENP